MGRRVAGSSMGTRLCLLYLLEGWLASRLALAAANETPGKNDDPLAYDKLIAQVTPDGLLSPRSKKKMDFKEGYFAKISCKDDELIHIAWAKWLSTLCVTKFDVTAAIREECNNKDTCNFIPSPHGGGKWYIKLGDPCKHLRKRLTGRADCWNPCYHANCGEGKCVPKVYNSYKCDCLPGYVNADRQATGQCIKNRCEPNPCGRGTCELTQRNFSYKCHCPTGQFFSSGTCMPHDTCKASPSPCPKGASCTDGYGKAPKCTCPELHVEQKGSCVAIDTCENMHCPPETDCTDGVGRQGKCQCRSKYDELKDGKCEHADQCLINNGGCDPKASCTDGVGKRPKCSCPKDYKMEKEKCVFENLCLTDNGGCHQNASCEHKEGEEVKCTCKEGFIGDGQACYGSKSFFFPDNGSIRMILRDVEGSIFYDLGKCLRVVADPETNYYSVTSPDRAPQTNAKSRQNRETMEGGTYMITVHRQLYVIEVLIDVYPKESTDLGSLAEIRRSWNDSCAIDEVTVRDDRGPQTNVEFYMTPNIYVGRGIVGDT